MKNINFGIIGFGSIAKTHALSAYDANLRFNLPYTLNPSSVLTRKDTALTLPSAKNYTSFEDMIHTSDLHFLDICTPNNTHQDYVEMAVKANLPIYCEKPLAENLEAATKMMELVSENNIHNAVAFMYRFLPAINILKQEIKKGTIGSLIHFKIATYHSSYLSSAKAGTWRTKAASGGGALLDLGVHLIDLIHYVLGEITDITSNMKIHFKDRSYVDEYAFCNVITNEGTEGTLEVSRISAETNNRDAFEIYGETGSLKVNMKQPYVVEYFNETNHSTSLLYPSKELLETLNFPQERACLGFFQSAHTASLIVFANSIYANTVSEISANFSDALKVQRVVEMAYNNSNS
ncbi:gfo/Idh/MocA family oxidoreductase [Bacillus sp. HMF5848]|uniref:Gfo/Idh/MocA family protein n=1 Tax=Bacillus sp. HMF5848 TaxID=2495421 RepID=UPI000F76DD7D|nr:Gfo/Idh/MocA family oxidoreductase [Bacillus sp. HMF5848]RSK25878.1 gfo/Idh/MocA family oxidoreductase [Bacillus sp. HMF5848]